MVLATGKSKQDVRITGSDKYGLQHLLMEVLYLYRCKRIQLVYTCGCRKEGDQIQCDDRRGTNTRCEDKKIATENRDVGNYCFKHLVKDGTQITYDRGEGNGNNKGKRPASATSAAPKAKKPRVEVDEEDEEDEVSLNINYCVLLCRRSGLLFWK